MPARKEITSSADILAKYVGVYSMAAGANMVVTLERDQLYTKLGNQQATPIFPESKTMFFTKVVDAELEFKNDDDQGRPTQLILHQNGRDMPGRRLSDAEAKQIVDAAAAFAQRFKDQTPVPGTEAAVRKMIDDLWGGEPDDNMMSPGAPIRQQLPQLQSEVKQLGKIQSIRFQGVGPGGADIYSVKSENGAWEYL
jgi:hypothetical protein